MALGGRTLGAGLRPAGSAWCGGQIVDAVVVAAQLVRAGSDAPLAPVLWLVALEGGLVAAMAGAQRGIGLCQSLLRAQLGQQVNEMILAKALTLDQIGRAHV